MKGHEHETISALLDGELSRRQRRRVLHHLRACPDCTGEYRRQRGVRRLLRSTAAAPAMPLSGDLFWTRVRGAIQQAAVDADPSFAPAPPAPATRDWAGGARWAWATVAVAAVVVVVGLGVFWQHQPPAPAAPGQVAIAPPPPPRTGPPPAPQPVYAEVERAATVLPNTTVSTFDAKQAGVTVLWVDGLPWTPDMNEMQTLYANLD
jgi:hypothetical protein